MSKLAEQRARIDARLPEAKVRVCLDGALVSEQRILADRLADLREKAAAATAREAAAMASEIETVRDQMAANAAKIGDAEGDITVRAIRAGAWREWCIAHPPRDPEDDKAAALRDFRLGGIVNADDLMVEVEQWISAYDDDPLAPGDWEWLESTLASGDMAEIGRTIVMLQEARSEAPKADLPSTPESNGNSA